MQNFLKSESRFLILIIITFIVTSFFYGNVDYTLPQYSHLDLFQYKKMAEAAPLLATDVKQPFAFRIAGPWLAGILPFETDTSFYILSYTLLFSIVIIFYHILRRSGIKQLPAFLTLVLLMCNKQIYGCLTWNVFQLNDILSLFLLTGSLIFLWDKKWFLFGLTLLLGALTRAANMVIIPVGLLYLYEQRSLKPDYKKYITVVIPAVILFLAIRVCIPHEGGENLLEAFNIYKYKIVSPEKLFRIIINSFIPVALIPFIFYKTTAEYLRMNKYAILFTIIIIFSILFGSDTERLMAPVFIFYYYIIAIIIQNLKPDKFFTMLLIISTVITFPHHVLNRYTLSSHNYTYIFTFTGIGLTTLLFMYYNYKRKKHIVRN